MPSSANASASSSLLPAFEPVPVPSRSSSRKPKDLTIEVHRPLLPMLRGELHCFCGQPLSSDETIYCSTPCARQDAMVALVAPSTPPNKLALEPPSTPRSKRKDQKLDLAEIGASHYRRMEALGMYDPDTPPTPTLIRTTRSDSVASSVLASPMQPEFPREQTRSVYFDCTFDFQTEPIRKVMDLDFPMPPSSPRGTFSGY